MELTIDDIYGTHDSLSGYPELYWFLKPFNIFAKCQNKTLAKQFEEGARCYDARFAKHCGKWYGAHGAMLYNITLEQAWDELIELSKKEQIYVRVICEDTFYKKSDWEELLYTVSYLEKSDNLNLLYVRSKRNWENVIESDFYEEKCADHPELWDTPYTRKGIAKAVQKLYEMKTSSDKLNFIACYSSKFIPKLFARILTPIAKEITLPNNNIRIVDFI